MWPEATEGDSSAQDDIDATRRYVGQEAEVIGGGAENGHFTGVRPNREQRRKQLKNKEDRMVLQAITLTFEGGQTVDLDIGKVHIVDRETRAVLFNEVIEG